MKLWLVAILIFIIICSINSTICNGLLCSLFILTCLTLVRQLALNHTKYAEHIFTNWAWNLHLWYSYLSSSFKFILLFVHRLFSYNVLLDSLTLSLYALVRSMRESHYWRLYEKKIRPFAFVHELNLKKSFVHSLSLKRAFVVYLNIPYYDFLRRITKKLCVKIHRAVQLISQVCAICATNSMALWNLFNTSVEFVQLVVDMIPRHRGSTALVHNLSPRLRGLGCKVLWNLFREPIST